MTNVTLSMLAGQVVTVRKIEDHGHLSGHHTFLRSDFTGTLVGPPRVGHGLRVCRLPGGDTLLTSPVVEVTVDPDGAVRVETVNSTYRLEPSVRTAAGTIDDARQQEVGRWNR